MRPLALPLLLAAACASPGGSATLENDGSWVRAFAADPDAVYHAALRVLLAEGYEVERANPLAGSIVARSPIVQSGLVVRYTIARVDVVPWSIASTNGMPRACHIRPAAARPPRAARRDGSDKSRHNGPHQPSHQASGFHAPTRGTEAA